MRQACPNMVEHPVGERREVEADLPHPAGQHRAAECNAVESIDAFLPIKRQGVGIFGDRDMGEKRLRRHAAFDQARRRFGLGDPFMASLAGIFGPPRHDYLEARRHHIEPLAHILADLHERAELKQMSLSTSGGTPPPTDRGAAASKVESRLANTQLVFGLDLAGQTENSSSDGSDDHMVIQWAFLLRPWSVRDMS
jgi:hypothetical protein